MNGRFVCIPFKIDPRANILAIFESCKSQYKVIDLDFKIGKMIPIMAEKILLYQLFLNFIGNAIKYRSIKQILYVEVLSTKVGQSVCYYVKDNGIGMDLKDRTNIYDIFKRLPNSQGYEGSGIGLSIVKSITEGLNAEITVESEIEIGTTYCVEFKNEVF